MVKSKFTSKNGISGRRKNRKLATRKGQQESDDCSIKVGPEGRKSASVRKFDLFGIDMGQLSKPPVMDQSPDCYFITQSQNREKAEGQLCGFQDGMKIQRMRQLWGTCKRG